MPTYEYTCRQCGETIEVWQSFKDKPLKKHADCGGELKKVFHARGIVFKGDGFYATDSKTAASTKTADSSNGESKSGDGKKKDVKKSDSAPKKESKAKTPTSSSD